MVVLTLLSIALHESGHLLVYKLAGYPVRISLQSVRPVGAVNPALDWWAKLAGPGTSWIAAALFLVVAARRPSFAWTTASFTNASIRLFPCAMDLVRAWKNAPAFSDEGEVALALTSGPAGRASLVTVAAVVSLVLTLLAARQYRFARRAVLGSVAIYCLSLGVGIAVVIVDELLH